MGKTVSVIIPNYNQGDYLIECIQSLLRQSRPPQEILVVDDGSTDHSREVLKRHALEEPSLRYLCLPRNMGAAEACAQGLAAASGDLVYHSAADDPVLPKFIEASATLLERHPQAGLCVTDFRGIYANGDWETVRFGISGRPSYISPDRFVEFAKQQDFLNLPTHTATYYRQRQIACGGIIRPLKWHHDWFVALVVAFRHGICYHPESLKFLRCSSESYSSTGQRDRLSQQEVLGNIFDLLDSPAYADVREFFKMPSVIGRFGFKLVDMLLNQERLWPYFSWEVFARALQGESAHLEKDDFRDLQEMDRERQIATARNVLENVAVQMESTADGLAAQRNYEDAVSWYQKLCDLRPQSAQASYKLGASLFKGGWSDQAVKYLERAEGLDPDNGDIRNALGDARQAALRMQNNSVRWGGRWASTWGKRDWPPYKTGTRLWSGPNDTRPQTGLASAVSVLLWNLGDPRQLDATLSDLAAQTLKPGEVILVGADPGEEYEAWGKRFPRLLWAASAGGEQEPPWGQRPLSLARGEYLLFLAAGDRLHNDYLRQAVAAMEEAPKVGVCLTPRQARPGQGPEPLLMNPLQLAEMGDDNLVMERGFLLRREAAHFPPAALVKLEWLGGWFLGLYVCLARGVCLLPEPFVTLNPDQPWAGEPDESQGEQGQRRSAVMAALLNTVMVGQLRYLRALLAYGGFLARVGPSLIKAAMGMTHMWNAETMMVLQYPLFLWNRERAERAGGMERLNGLKRASETERPSEVERAVEIERPGLDSALMDLERGRQEVSQGRLREAEAIFSRLASQRPDLSAAPAALAVLAGSRGDHDQARQLLEEACRLDPDNPLALLQLGRAYQRLGLGGQASQAFHQVLALDPQNQEARGCLSQMTAQGPGH
jgi:glycosyltransferase involved in cell wall biosynthesis/Flp pilus assembly protein TadD